MSQAQLVGGLTINSRSHKIIDVTNKQYNATCIAKTRLGFLYHGIHVRFRNLDVAQMRTLKVKVNEQILYSMTGDDLDVIAFYENNPDAGTAGVLYIPFKREDLLTGMSEVLTSINLQDEAGGYILTELAVEIEIGARTAAQATANVAAPELEFFADVQNTMVGVGPGFVRRFEDKRETGVVAGKTTLANFTSLGVVPAQKSQISRLWLNIAPTAWREIVVTQNNQIVDRIDPAVNEARQLRHRRRPVEGWSVIDTMASGLGGNGYNLAEQRLDEFRVEIDVTTPPANGVLRYLVEYIGPFR